MAERPEDNRFNRAIVPDPDASLTGHRGPTAPKARLWPLWCLILLLVAMLVTLTTAGWWFHQQVQQRLTQLSGELSNIHARFDAEQGRGDALSSLQQRLEDLESQQASLNGRIDDQLSQWAEQRISPVETRLNEVSDQLSGLAEDAEIRDETLSAVRSSLDTLERAGQEGRASLQQRLTEIEEVNQRVDERFSSTTADQQAMQERLSELAGDIEANSGSREDTQAQVETLSSNLNEMQTELRDLRQAQLALSAQLESLR